MRIYKDIGFICFHPLPPPPNKDIKNKDILLKYLTPSLLPKIRTDAPFVFGLKKTDFLFLSHNFYGVGKFKNKLVKCSWETWDFFVKFLHFSNQILYIQGKDT